MTVASTRYFSNRQKDFLRYLNRRPLPPVRDIQAFDGYPREQIERAERALACGNVKASKVTSKHN